MLRRCGAAARSMPEPSVELAASGSARHPPSRPCAGFLASATDRPAIAPRRELSSVAGYAAHQCGGDRWQDRDHADGWYRGASRARHQSGDVTPGNGRVAWMITPPSGVHVWLAAGVTDMRRGMNSLALQVQQSLSQDPHAGDL